MATPVIENRKSQDFLSNLDIMVSGAIKKETEIDQAAKQKAAELSLFDKRMKQREASGIKQASTLRRKLNIFTYRRKKAYQKMSVWAKFVLWPLIVLFPIILFFTVQFLAASAVALTVLTMLGSVFVKIGFFLPKIIKSSFVVLKCCTRTYTGTISTYNRHKKIAHCPCFSSAQKQGQIKIQKGFYFKNTLIEATSGQRITLKHSTLNYGIDGFRIMNLYTMILVPFYVVFYILTVLILLLLALLHFVLDLLSCEWRKENILSSFWQRLQKSFHDPEKPKTGNFFRWDFWIYLIGNFKTAYVRMDKPEDVGPTFLPQQSNWLMRVYREINPKMEPAVDPSIPQNIKQELSMGEKKGDIAISAITAPGVAAALAMGDIATALLLLDQTAMMIGAGGHKTHCGSKIYIVEDKHHFVCIPADMELTDVYDTPKGVVICAEGLYARPKCDWSWKKPFPRNWRNDSETYKWQILVKKSST
jgi:hypothetical protein